MKTTRSIKINFPKHIRDEFLDMNRQILNYIKSISPRNQIILTFTIDEYEDGTTSVFKSFCSVDKPYSPNFEIVENVTWRDFEINIPKLHNFCEKYNLEHAFTTAEGVNVPPHRHYHTTQSMWSITMFVGESSGTMKFYDNKNPIAANSVIEKVNRDESNFTVSEEIKTMAGDFYSINTWNWHGWVADRDNASSLATLFYMKNTASYNQAVEHILKIKNS